MPEVPPLVVPLAVESPLLPDVAVALEPSLAFPVLPELADPLVLPDVSTGTAWWPLGALGGVDACAVPKTRSSAITPVPAPHRTLVSLLPIATFLSIFGRARLARAVLFSGRAWALKRHVRCQLGAGAREFPEGPPTRFSWRSASEGLLDYPGGTTMVTGRATTCSPASRMKPRKRGRCQARALSPRNVADEEPPLWVGPPSDPDPGPTGRAGCGENGSCDGRGVGRFPGCKPPPVPATKEVELLLSRLDFIEETDG